MKKKKKVEWRIPAGAAIYSQLPTTFTYVDFSGLPASGRIHLIIGGLTGDLLVIPRQTLDAVMIIPGWEVKQPPHQRQQV